MERFEDSYMGYRPEIRQEEMRRVRGHREETAEGHGGQIYPSIEPNERRDIDYMYAFHRGPDRYYPDRGYYDYIPRYPMGREET